MKRRESILFVLFVLWACIQAFECQRKDGKLICEENIEETEDTAWDVFQDKSSRAAGLVFEKFQGAVEKLKEKLTPDVHKRVDQAMYDFHYFYNKSGHVAALLADGLLAAANQMQDKYEDVKNNEQVQETLHKTVETIKSELGNLTQYGVDYGERLTAMISEIWSTGAEKATQKTKDMAQDAASKMSDAKDVVVDKARKAKEETRSLLGTVLYFIAHRFGYEEPEETYAWETYPEEDHENTVRRLFDTISTYSGKLTSTCKGATMDLIHAMTSKGEQGTAYSKEKMQKLHEVFKKYSEQSRIAAEKFKYKSNHGVSGPTPEKIYTPNVY
jgi:quinol monooxygenase YgiN